MTCHFVNRAVVERFREPRLYPATFNLGLHAVTISAPVDFGLSRCFLHYSATSSAGADADRPSSFMAFPALSFVTSELDYFLLPSLQRRTYSYRLGGALPPETLQVTARGQNPALYITNGQLRKCTRYASFERTQHHTPDPRQLIMAYSQRCVAAVAATCSTTATQLYLGGVDDVNVSR